jgi:hypothetical protein
VCWDQNFTHLGGGKWTTVTFLTPSEYNKTDLAYNDPNFPPENGPSVANGIGGFGVETGNGGVRAWQNHQWADSGGPGLDLGADHATRVQTCVHDNENGTLTIKQGTLTSTIAGQIPNGPIRVVFNDDNYNPDKHFSTDVERGAAGLPGDPRLTWHWDNIAIS